MWDAYRGLGELSGWPFVSIVYPGQRANNARRTGGKWP